MGKNYNIKVDINDIKSKQSLINQKYSELYEMVKTFQKMFDETEQYYDTPSSKKLCLVGDRYIGIALLYLENNFKPFVDGLDKVTSSYTDFLVATNKTVEVSDNYEV